MLGRSQEEPGKEQADESLSNGLFTVRSLEELRCISGTQAS